MQTEYKVDTAAEKAPLPALPPASPPKKRIRRAIIAQRFICAICATVALTVLTMSAVQKIDEILTRGVINYLSDELLSINGESSPTLGDRISYIAFGSPILPDKEIFETSNTVSLPRIYYIPKEKIADDIFSEKEEYENKVFDLYAFDMPEQTP